MEAESPAFAVLGAGAVVTARHLPALRAIGGRVLSVFDPAMDAARAAADSFEIPHVAKTFEEAIATDGVRAVLIASPNSFHREQAELAFAWGRHVLCEKPLALTLEDSSAIRKAAEHAECVLQVGFHHRFSAEQLCVKHLIRHGVLGEVRAFSGSLSEPLEVVPGGIRNYRFDSKQGGGFTLIDVGQHRLDQMRDMLGDFSSVSCEMASVLDSHRIDDSVALNLRMESGAIGSIGWHRFSRAFTSPLMLYGTKATVGCSAFITGPFQSAPVSVYLDEAPESILPAEMLAWARPSKWWGGFEAGWVDLWPPRRDTFQEQFRSFLRTVSTGGSPVADGTDGFKAVEIVQAAYRSYRLRRSIDLPLQDVAHEPPPEW
ncbi:MAG: Gfo/Idh/MocA family oxidoreductase [Bryobacterales bacterium]|nr:Gfo/Idh/MocA family oxidoreductase [Bryobacterales bacterium]